MKKIILTILLFISFQADAKHLHPEHYYQNLWCAAHNGQEEVVLKDGTRVDCVTDTNAIEFDFAKKWAEAHGQAIRYSRLTGKKGGIVLILENPKKEYKYYQNLLLDVKDRNTNIDVWTMP